MHEQMQQLTSASHYVVWVVPGAWWIIDLERDEVHVPDGPLPWPAPSLN